MAIDFIKIARNNPDATESGELLSVKNLLRQAYELGERVRAKMRHNFSDAAGEAAINWSQVETLWGIPAGSTSIGSSANGARVFTFIDGWVGALEGTFQNSAGKDFTETVG